MNFNNRVNEAKNRWCGRKQTYHLHDSERMCGYFEKLDNFVSSQIRNISGHKEKNRFE